MTLETRSFFLGIATVAGLLVVGFGGGILMGGVLTGERTPNKIERQAAAKDEKPGQPVITPAEAKPVPVVEAKPAVTAPSPQPPQTPPAAAPTTAAPLATPPVPQQQAAQPEPAPAPAEQKRAVAATEQKPAVAASEPTLGPEKPVALTPQPADQARPLSRREEARIRKEQRRAAREQRREERRKLIAERRERDQLRRQEIRADRLKRQDFDDDDDDVADARPVVREHAAPRAPDLPFFRMFGGD